MWRPMGEEELKGYLAYLGYNEKDIEEILRYEEACEEYMDTGLEPA